MEKDWWDSDGSDEIPKAPSKQGNANVDDEDLFDFTSEPIFDEAFLASLPPLAPGVEDCIGDRGVLLKRILSSSKHSSSTNGQLDSGISARSVEKTTSEASTKLTEVSSGSKKHTVSGNGSSASGVCEASTEPSASENNTRPSKTKPFVEFHYCGYVVEEDGSNGEIFDSSKEYPLIAKLDFSPLAESGVIRGLDKALRCLSIGERAEVTISAPYAYGEEGCAPNIPPGAALRFELNILDVRSTHKAGAESDEDEEENDLSRLDAVRREREIASARRQELQAAKGNSGKPDRIAALREKLANKQAKGGKRGKGKKK